MILTYMMMTMMMMIKKKDDDIDTYRKKVFMLVRIIEFMMRSGFSIGQIVAHLTYHTTLTTIQGSGSY